MPLAVRNRWAFAVGTTGRDAVYTLVTMYLVYYLTEAVDLSDWALGWVTTWVLLARLFDAVMDVVMGAVVDNTRTRWGPYKPWITGGALVSAAITVLLFTDPGLADTGYVVFFAVAYLLWGLAWTTNDIPYWSLLPALSIDKAERERTGSLTKVFATIGLAACVVSVLPATQALRARYGTTGAWTGYAVVLVAVMLAGQLVTLLGVREPRLAVEQPKTSLRELAQVVLRNDQLLVVALAQTLFMVGFLTTTSFGTYFFKYVYRDEAMYTPFGAVLLGSQVLGFLVFPQISRRLSRRRVYEVAIGLVVVGYLAFLLGPISIVWIGCCGLAMFVGQAWIVVLMLMLISEAIDYGHLKLGRRNQAVTFALQPFINKVGGAIATAIVSVVVIVSGINVAPSPDAVTPGGLLTLRLAMLLLPMLLIVAGYLVYRARHTLDEAAYAEVLARLREQNQLVD